MGENRKETMVKISERELNDLRKMKTEFFHLKKALVTGHTWEQDENGVSKEILILDTGSQNPYIKAIGEVDKKISEELVPRISLILEHLGMHYSDDPRLVKTNCVREE